MTGSEGTEGQDHEGWYNLARVPMLPGDWQVIVLETEPINPLYTGQYAVGPYTANTVEPSGSNTLQIYGIFSSYVPVYIPFSTTDPASSCSPGAGGTEASPATVATAGGGRGSFADMDTLPGRR